MIAFPIVLVLFMAAAFGSMFLFIPWSVHKDMTINHSRKWGRGTFPEFAKAFLAEEWEWGGNPDRLADFPESFFNHAEDSEIHASIYKFKGVGMTLGFIDYWKAHFFLKDKINEQKSKFGKGNTKSW